MTPKLTQQDVNVLQIISSGTMIWCLPGAKHVPSSTPQFYRTFYLSTCWQLGVVSTCLGCWFNILHLHVQAKVEEMGIWHNFLITNKNTHDRLPCVPQKTPTISMASCKTAVSPLLTHWKYCSLALSHRYTFRPLQSCDSHIGRHSWHGLFSVLSVFSWNGLRYLSLRGG